MTALRQQFNQVNTFQADNCSKLEVEYFNALNTRQH